MSFKNLKQILVLWNNHVASIDNNDIPELKLSEKAVKVSQCILHAVCVQVEVSQGLVSGDVAYLLQAAGQIFSQGPHCYTLYLPVHDDGAGGQTLHGDMFYN